MTIFQIKSPNERMHPQGSNHFSAGTSFPLAKRLGVAGHCAPREDLLRLAQSLTAGARDLVTGLRKVGLM